MARDVVFIYYICLMLFLRRTCVCQVCDTQVLELDVKKERKLLEFPGSQNASNNVYHCHWRLATEDEDDTIEIAMQSVFISHSGNCSMSSLTLYDGHDPTDYLLRQECNNRTQEMVVNSSNEFVYIVWVLPIGMATSNTFTLTYTALETENKTHTFTKTTLAGVVAGIILFIVFAVSIVMAIVCCLRNRSNMQRRDTRLHDSYRNDT